MNYTMSLFEKPFQAIQSGKKRIEIRLNDEKRKRIQTGDTIEFEKLPERKETVKVKVGNLCHFRTFEEMFNALPAKDFNCEGCTTKEMLKGIYKIYAPEMEKKWGTLAIEIRLV